MCRFCEENRALVLMFLEEGVTGAKADTEPVATRALMIKFLCH